ncbi:MAG: MarR family transcriptional regulator [Myxococcota bacterium]
MQNIAKEKGFAERLRVAMGNLGRVVCLRDPLSPTIDLELTRPQIHVVMALAHESLPMGELSRRIGATGPTITGIVDRLESLGLVERQRDASDRRVIHLHLTRKGQTLSAKLESRLDERLRSLLVLLDDEDQRTFTAIVERLAERAARVAEPVMVTAIAGNKRVGARRG